MATASTLRDEVLQFLGDLENRYLALGNGSRVLCVKVKQAEYAGLFEQVWGAGSLDCVNDVDGVYEKIGRSVAAYERSAGVNPFTSKFDKFWDNAKTARKDVTKIRCGTGGGGMMGCSGSGTNGRASYRNLGFSDAELQGLAVFNDKAGCSTCHSLKPGSAGRPLFTNFGYNNLGVPKNPANPFYAMPPEWNPDGQNWVDYGLGDYLKSAGYPHQWDRLTARTLELERQLTALRKAPKSEETASPSKAQDVIPC